MFSNFYVKQMNMLELTMFVFNILLIVIIISVYVKLSFIIKQQGFQISVLLKEGYRNKEAMSPGQRFGNARKYRGAYNALMPDDKQVPPTDEYIPTLSNSRGDRSMSYLFATNVTDADLHKAGANVLPQISHETSSIQDTSALPAVVQTGLINTEDIDPANYSVNPRSNPSAIMDGKTTMPNKIVGSGISSGKDGYRSKKYY